MALSNMRKEPRREITEQVVGVLAIVAFVAADYVIAGWVFTIKGTFDRALAMILTAAGSFVLLPVFFLTHILGEAVCGWLAGAGIDPRPKQRYR